MSQTLKLRIDAYRLLKFGSGLIFNIRISESTGPWIFRVVNRTLQFNPKIESDDRTVLLSFIHSLLFLILQHDIRCKDFIDDENDKMLWNIASELCRTDVLRKLRILNYGERLFWGPEAFELESNRTVEEYFTALKSNADDAKRELEKRGVDTKNSIVFPVFGEEFIENKITDKLQEVDIDSLKEGRVEFESDDTTADSDGSSVPNDAEQAAFQNMMMELLTEAAAQMMLKGTGSGIREFDRLRKYRTRYDVIRRLVSVLRTFAFSFRGRPVFTNRPARRQISNVDMLHLGRAQVDKIAIVVDVSGSTEPDEIKDKIYETLYSIVKHTNLIDVYFADTAILGKFKKVRHPECIKEIPRGLGTDMGFVVTQLDSQSYRAIIVITDGQTGWPEKPTRTPVFVIIVGDNPDPIPNWIRRVM